LLNSSQIN